MPFNPVGRILCPECQHFVDGDDCPKCGWQQEPFVEDPKNKLVALVQEGINYLQEHGHYPEAADLEYNLLKILGQQDD